MSNPQQLPLGRFPCIPQHRADPQPLPQLAQPAQNRGLGQLPAQFFPRLDGGEPAILIQRLPQFQHQRRNLMPGGLLRSMLPIRIAPQGNHKGECLAMSQKIRLFPYRAQQVQRHHRPRCDQPRQQALCLFDRGNPRSCLATP